MAKVDRGRNKIEIDKNDKKNLEILYLQYIWFEFVNFSIYNVSLINLKGKKYGLYAESV